MPKAMIIPADITKRASFVDLPTGAKGLKEMQRIVGGYIELIPLTLNLAGVEVEVCMFDNEEGKLEGLPLNIRATMMAKNNLHPGDYIAGDVFLVGPPDDEGNETDVPIPLCFEA